MLPEEFSTHGGAKRRFSGRKSVPSQNGDRTGQAALSHSRANSRVSACVDQGETRFTPIPIERSTKSPSRSGLGLSDLQHSAVAATGLEAKSSSRRIVGTQPRPKNGMRSYEFGCFEASVKRFRCPCRCVSHRQPKVSNIHGLLEGIRIEDFQSNLPIGSHLHRPPLQRIRTALRQFCNTLRRGPQRRGITYGAKTNTSARTA